MVFIRIEDYLSGRNISVKDKIKAGKKAPIGI